MDSTGQLPTVLSFCTGYGGLEIGLERAIGRINVLAHVEVEAFAIANLVNKMETGRMDPAPIWSDIKTLNSGIFRGHVDILTGGYPCQPFSAAGKRLGSDDPRHLWPYIKEHIRIIRPSKVFLENVEGHLSKGVAEVLADLEEMAYRVECGVFSATEIGAPHQRKRVFILGELADAEQWIKYKKCSEEFSRCPILAHSRGEGPPTTGGSKQTRRVISPECSGGGNRWPARPGQPQYEWEEPRTVADTQLPRTAPNRVDSGMGWEEQQTPGRRGAQIEIKSQLGRALDGNTDRVDRLRLLGNGVVPATAEKAFITLYNKLLNTVGI